MITPKEAREFQFTRVRWGGVDRLEVERFRDGVADALFVLDRRARELEARRGRVAEDPATNVMAEALETKERILARARERVAMLVAHAEERARSIVAAATQEADELRSEAERLRSEVEAVRAAQRLAVLHPAAAISLEGIGSSGGAGAAIERATVASTEEDGDAPQRDAADADVAVPNEHRPSRDAPTSEAPPTVDLRDPWQRRWD